MTISFLVPTLGTRYDELKRLLESLERQESKCFEVVVVAQGNYEVVEELCFKYDDSFRIQYVRDERKGLSRARNCGLPYCKGDIVVLSDDDCWYPKDAVKQIYQYFERNSCDVVLTQIYDEKKGIYYKNYSPNEECIKSPFSLLSRSSIEIAFKKELASKEFDEAFGLGAQYVCCEEIDFLLRVYKAGARVVYVPNITVYHEKKYQTKNKHRIVAKGALYAKNFNVLIGILICVRDLILKRENNFKLFFKGYYEYIKREN
ncbi:MAG: glycosyltransferase family 2 protein [Roseburia sp.]|nr:glycosyltransferase family 2 protein [Roseburia sp.]